MNHRFPDDVDNDGGEAGQSASFDGGSMLRFAREAAGLHIGALAVALKVPVKKLEALESDRYDLLPDVVFVRALASTVCRNLKIDAGPILERLPQVTKPKFAVSDRGINAPFRVPGTGMQPTMWSFVSRPAAFWGLSLLLGALALVLLPATQETVEKLKSAVFDTNDRDTVDSVASDSPVGSPSPAPSTVIGVVSPINPNLEGAPAFVTGAKVEPQTSAVSSPLSGTIVQGPSSAAISSTTKEVLTFTAKEQSWVEVTDAKGVVILRRTLAMGEVVGVSGVLPFAAVVGRADAISVEVRGAPFELAAVAKNNVARFEVK